MKPSNCRLLLVVVDLLWWSLVDMLLSGARSPSAAGLFCTWEKTHAGKRIGMLVIVTQ